MVDVSVIIVGRNTKQLVYDCLKSAYDQTGDITFEVIYVDNASNDGSCEMVAGEFGSVNIIRNETNMGFTVANNQGIKVAKGRYVLLLNSDTIVLNNAVAKTVKFADSHPEAAVVGCRVLNPDMTLQRNCFMYPSVLNLLLAATYLYKVFPGSRFFGRELMTWWDFGEVREVETVCGCFSLVRREAIEQVGLMDERFFFYGDDPDWCWRFKKTGWKIIFTPEPQIIHYGGQSTRYMAERFKLQLYGAKLTFIKLHANRFKFIIACIFTALFFLLRVPYWVVAALLSNNNRGKAIRIAKAYLTGFFYCLTDWKKLLMNRDIVQEQF
jgi:GT2 family glycosyltransferase